MTKLKLITVVGTRPEIIRLSEVIKACDRYFEHILVHTGQNWDFNLNEVFFNELNLRAPDYNLNAAGDSLGDTIGAIISKSYNLFKEIMPDGLLILGDTNSALCAISAKRLKIPVFHMEAGNRCFDENVPEELNRRIVDHISDINLPYTEHGRRNLLNEGLKSDRIFVTGSPMTEVLSRNKAAILKSDVLARLSLKENEYFLVSAHREENVDNGENFYALMMALNAVAEQYGLPVIYSTHPRSLKRITERGFSFNPLVRSLKPFGFFDYNRLQISARCVLSDSGTLSEESVLLKFPAVLLRTSTERPEALDKGSVVIGGITSREITEAIELAVAMNNNHEPYITPQDYTDEYVSTKVVRIIESYTKIINELVWRKGE